MLAGTRARALLVAGVVAAVAFAGGLTMGWAAGGSSPRPEPARRAPRAPRQLRVSVYGDSLSVQAGPYLAGVGRAFGLRVTVRAFSGTAPCDFLDPLRKDLAAGPGPPDLVLFAFSGNSVGTCMLDASGRPLTGVALLAKYRADTVAAADLTTAAHRPFLVASPPAPRGKEGIWKALDDVYRDVATTHPGVQYVDAGQDIAPGGEFAPTQQCLPFESKIPGAQRTCRTVDSDIPVRGPDGGHFCGDAAPTAAVLCPSYSSGAMRYAVNLLSAAKLTLDVPAARAGL